MLMGATHYLRPLLAPASVALVGASGRAGSLGRIVYENLLGGEFKGELFAVNPRHRRVLGRKAFASLEAIGRPVDLALICAPGAAVPAIVAQSEGRARSVAILSGAAGMGEAGYLRWERGIAARARAAGVRVLGPGSFGIIRTEVGLNATYASTPALAGRLTLISQSGAMVSALLEFAHAVGAGFASVVALGAAIDLDFGEILEFALADSATDGIVLYVESLRDARRFLSALRAAARTKPVVILKAGRGMAPEAGALPGIPDADRVFDAAIKRAGTVRVHTYTQLFAAALILAAGRIPRGNRLAIVTNGRGPGVITADCAADSGVALAALESRTRTAIAAFMPDKQSLGPFLDIGNEATPETFAIAARTLLADPGVDAVLVLHVAMPSAPATDTARAIAAPARGADKPILAAWLGAVDDPEARAALEAGGVVHFHTPENAVDAFSFLAAYRRNQEWLLQVPPPMPEPLLPDLAAALRVRERALAEGRSVLSPGETQVLLAAFGIAMRMAIVASAEQARAAARELGFPVALELEIDGLSVLARENIRNGPALSHAFGELRRSADKGRRGPASHVIVRRQIDPNVHAVARVSVTNDAVFGPVIGFGGLLAPAAGQSLMLPPLNHVLAVELIAGADHGEFKSAETPLAALLLNVSALVCASPWVVELELAPVVTLRGIAMVIGARARIDGSRPIAAAGYPHMAIHPYPAELEDEIQLADKTVLRVRPIRPEDAMLEQAFVAGLSERSRYMRFMQHLPELTPQMLARFTQVDYDRELALVAIDDVSGGDHIVGVARYVANPDGESVEFAIVVADAWQGRGLGRALMLRLIASAATRGYTQMTGGVLAMNKTMLEFVSGLGFASRRDPDDDEQMIVTLALPKFRKDVAQADAGGAR
jgi:acetyltransferase